MGIILDCGGKQLDLSHTHVMGVLNVTPDSFSDGGAYVAVERAVERAWQMVDEGASIVDIGGESTRPGAEPVGAQEELGRVLPVIEALAASDFPIPISVDTSKPEVMRQAVDAGAALINDVRALREPGAVEAAVALGVPVCLMHMQGEPASMQQQPYYDNVVEEVLQFLEERVRVCEQAGLARERLLIDPGFGFGKTLDHNLSLLRHLDRFLGLQLPVLIGLSRKRMIGGVVDADSGDRVHGSVAGAVLAAWMGASIVRVHDVRATADAMRICEAVRLAE